MTTPPPPPPGYGSQQYGGYPGQGYPPPPGGYPPPPRRRNYLPLAAGAVAVVLALVVAGIVIFRADDDSAPDTQAPSAALESNAASATEAVQGYLEALARGDAAAALSFVAAPPPDTTFLTNDVLAQQIAKYPITNIAVSGEGNQVHASADFGDTPSAATITLDPPAEGGGWKLREGAMLVEFDSLMPLNDKLFSALTLFGKPVPEARTTYVFPGWIDIGSADPNLTLVDWHQKVEMTTGIPSVKDVAEPFKKIRLEIGISDAGQDAVRASVKSIFDECAKSKLLMPPDCPQGRNRPDLVDGTVTWTAPTNLAYIDTLYLDGTTGMAQLFGSASFTRAAESRIRGEGVVTDDVTVSVEGTVDMTQTPPKVTLEM